MYIVTKDCVDLRAEPTAGLDPKGKDCLQLTQLIAGEEVEIVDVVGDWAQIYALDQSCCLDQQWRGYFGWVLRNALVYRDDFTWTHTVRAFVTAVYDQINGAVLSSITMGARVCVVNEHASWVQIQLPNGVQGWMEPKGLIPRGLRPKNWRSQLIASTAPFMGSGYFWGGLSAPQQEFYPRSGVDCSGLTHLLYRALNVSIPRDAHDQQLASRALTSDQMQPGDMVFSVEKDAGSRFDHVMLYAGGEELIEASMSTGVVSRQRFEHKLSVSKKALDEGKSAPNHRLAFGSFDA